MVVRPSRVLHVIPQQAADESVCPVHDYILIDELNRCGSLGTPQGLFGGLQIGCPPIYNFGEFSRFATAPGRTPFRKGD